MMSGLSLGEIFVILMKAWLNLLLKTSPDCEIFLAIIFSYFVYIQVMLEVLVSYVTSKLMYANFSHAC